MKRVYILVCSFLFSKLLFFVIYANITSSFKKDYSMRIFLTVIDSFGVGAMPDAYKFGDVGSNTYVNIYKRTKVALPVMSALGLRNIDGVNLPYNESIIGSYGKMSEKTFAKDTTAGHYEMSGIVLKNPFPVFPNAFPEELMDMLEKACKTKFLGNEVASGTEIIQRLGNEHIITHLPIIYTSQDSVLQIAAHQEIIPLEKLYELCEIARKVCVGKYNIARIIARPFITATDGSFVRTEYRKDFALLPPERTMLDKLKEFGYDVISVGKVSDVFCGQGITKSIIAKTNIAGLKAIDQLIDKNFKGLAFINLVDTDMLFGHRNDILGYAKALNQIDEALLNYLPRLRDDDIFIITGDHGCDPTTSSTDHSREYVPLLIYSKMLKNGINLGTLNGFDNIANAILDFFYVEKHEDSFLQKLMID